MIPFEFTIIGIPVSAQTRNRQRLRQYQGQVRARAQLLWPQDDPPEKQDLRLSITYYYDSVPLDVDNIGKPIQDALIGLVYNDDGQISDVNVSKRNINSSFRVRGMSPAVAEGFTSSVEFVHVRVEEAPDPQELVR